MNRLTEIIKSYYPAENTTTHKFITLSLLSCSRTYFECIKILEKFKGEKDILGLIFKENLSFCETIIDKNLKTVGVWFDEWTIGGQLLPYAIRFKQECNYRSIVFISATIFNNSCNSKIIEDLSSYIFIFLPDDEVMVELTFIDAIIFNEGYRYKTYLPKSVIRLAQPHGLDISYKNTIELYGGGNVFNYILAPMIEEYDNKNKYLNYFPTQMIEHSSEFVCVIPFGYPKLDLFIDRFKKVKPTKSKIIYHLSNIGLEDSSVYFNINKTIHELLEGFPNHEIVFRPYPGDLENSKIRTELNSFLSNVRFKISTSSSYVNDYAGADFLVSHRVATAQVFAYATGKPIIYFPLASSKLEVEEHKLGYLVYNHKDLMEIGKKIEKYPNQECARISRYRDKFICNPGNSLDYLIENLPYIFDNCKNEAWMYFPLYDCTKSLTEEDEYEQRLEQAVSLNISFENMARSAEFNYPDNILFKYFVILSLLQYKANSNTTYYYARWYEAICMLSKALSSSNIKSNLKGRLLLINADRGIEAAKNLKHFLNHSRQCYGNDIDLLITELESFNGGWSHITIFYYRVKRKIFTSYKVKLFKLFGRNLDTTLKGRA